MARRGASARSTCQCPRTRLVAKTSAVVVTREGGGDVRYCVDPKDGAGKLIVAGGGGLRVRVLAADHAAWDPCDAEMGACYTVL